MSAERQEAERLPRRCEKCGLILGPNAELAMGRHSVVVCRHAKWIPFDRRNPSYTALHKAREEAEADKAKLIEVLEKGEIIKRLTLRPFRDGLPRFVLRLDFIFEFLQDRENAEILLAEIKRKEKAEDAPST